MNRIYTTEEIVTIRDSYEKNGVALLKNFCVKKNLELVKEGIDFCLANPSPFSSKIQSTGGVFFHDYWTYKRNNSIKQLMSNHELVEVIKKIVETETLRLFHDHILIKNPLSPSTPWHHDRPYYFLDGPKVFSIWITPDKVDEENSLAFCAKSQKSGFTYVPVDFEKTTNISSHSSLKILDENSLIEESKNGIIVYRMQPGDAVIFNNKTLHRSLPSSATSKRSALSLRLVGDDTTLTTVCVENPQPPFHKFGMDLTEGNALDDTWFPSLPLSS